MGGSIPALSVRLRRAALTAALLGILFGVLYMKALPCAFARISHHPCPGCGSTRATLALLHGDVTGVFHYNPFGPVMAVLLGALALSSFVSVLRHGDFRSAGEGRTGVIIKRGVFIVAALEVLLWIIRFFGVFGGPVPLE